MQLALAEGCREEGTGVTMCKDVLYSAEITVLGIGNVILQDEGFGVRVVEYLASHYDFPENVQLVDGGTLGIELTQYVTGTQRLLVIDSINGGAEAGALFRFEDEAVMEHFQDKLSAHEVGVDNGVAFAGEDAAHGVFDFAVFHLEERGSGTEDDHVGRASAAQVFGNLVGIDDNLVG